MLGKVPFFDADLALATGQPPAADALDADTQLTCGLQHSRAPCKAAASSRGHEHN